MARFETFVPDREATIFDKTLWGFIAHADCCDLITAVHSYPEQGGARRVVDVESPDTLRDLSQAWDRAKQRDAGLSTASRS